MSENSDFFVHFSVISDPRVDRTKKHLLIDILFIGICSVICNGEGFEAMEDFGKARESWFRKFLELPHGIPSHDTFRRVLSILDSEEFGKCLKRWSVALHEATDGGVIALDGKTIRHSFDSFSGQRAVHLVSAWASESGLALGQVRVDDKSNEITALPALLEMIDVKGRVVTMDAMGCQKEIAKQIVEQEADYVFSLKGNQGNLHKEVRLLFEDAKKDGFKDLTHDSFTTVDGEHGRIETRRYTTVADLDWFEDKDKWAKLTSFGMIESEREVDGHITLETRYFISSLPSDAKRFAEAARGHWAVENSLHWCLDIAFREDDSRVRSGHAQENLATIRRLALNLIKQDSQRKIGVKATRKRAGWDMDYIKKLLGIA